MPRVSAVVVSHDGGARVLRCLEALARQTRPVAETILVDSGSRDGTPERVRRARPDVRVLELAGNDGPAAARNLGLETATGALVWWLDHDVYPDPDCLAELLAARAARPAELLVPRILLHPEADTIQCEGGEPHAMGTLVLALGFTPLARAVPHPPTYRNAAPSGCILIDREAALATGGFDPSYFFHLEDLEFSLRARILGLRILAVPTARARHDRGLGTALSYRGRGPYAPERARLLMRNRLRVLATHFAARTLLLLAPALLLYEAACLAYALARGWGGAWLAAWHALWIDRAALAARRRAVQTARRVPDRALLVGGPLPFAPGVLGSQAQRATASALGHLLDAWWRLVRPLL